MEFDVDTNQVTVLFEKGIDYAIALDYDYKHRYVYVPRYNFFDIVR